MCLLQNANSKAECHIINKAQERVSWRKSFQVVLKFIYCIKVWQIPCISWDFDQTWIQNNMKQVNTFFFQHELFNEHFWIKNYRLKYMLNGKVCGRLFVGRYNTFMHLWIIKREIKLAPSVHNDEVLCDEPESFTGIWVRGKRDTKNLYKVHQSMGQLMNSSN